jgi:ATP-binding cassette subfamily C protein CydCD
LPALDPRLLRHARATRRFLTLSVALGSLAALLIVAQAWLLAEVVSHAFDEGQSLQQLRTPMAILLAIVLARAVLAWLAELAANDASARAKSQLRRALIERLPALFGDPRRERRTGEVAILASRGIDALDDYFAAYLPQLLLAVIVPLVVLTAVVSGDLISAAIIAVTVPLVPLFMALVGASTGERTEREMQTLQRLADHFLDVVSGLPTLKVFGRAKAQASVIREVSERHRELALSTLRLAFLSSLVLELLATIAVALVAVAIGLRLMDGGLELRAALFVLILAPEAFLPLRRLGASYHASAEGLAAAEQIFALLEAPEPRRAPFRPMTTAAVAPIEIEGVTLTYPGRTAPALERLSLTIEPGETVALVGPSGCGKSTLLSVLLGLTVPDQGSVRIDGTELDRLDRGEWHERLAWLPQSPHLFAAPIADNVRIARPGASDEDVLRALSAAGLQEVLARIPGGMEAVLGDRGAGLSAGERQRLALARAFLRDAPLVLLDEPTASLDARTELAVVASLQRLAAGRTVLLVAHRPALVALADRVVTLAGEAVAA